MATNSGAGNYLLGSDGAFAVGYESGSTIIQTHGESASGDNQAAIEGLSDYSNKPRVLDFTHSSVDGNKLYINATLANEDSTSNATTHLSGLTALTIGENYNGEIGEIVIFDRKLKTVELREVEDYLSDKWNAPNNRDSSSSCTSGTITSGGCLEICSVSINGTTQSTFVDGYSGSTSLSCDSEYSGTITYTCDNGTPSGVTNNCVELAACDLDAEGILGVTQTGTVGEATAGELTCDDTNFDGETITYDCNSSGVFENVGTCGCDTTTKLSFLNDAGDACEDIVTTLRLDATNSSSITESSGDVSQWSDLSVSANNLTQSTLSKKPKTGISTINGLNALTFTSSDQVTLGAPLIGSIEDYTFFVVAKFNSLSGNQYVISQYDSNAERMIFMIYSSAYKMISGGVYHSSGVSLSTSNDYLLYSSRSGDNVSVEANLVGSTAATYGAGFTVAQVAFTIVINRTLTSTEKANIESYLNAKWALY